MESKKSDNVFISDDLNDSDPQFKAGFLFAIMLASQRLDHLRDDLNNSNQMADISPDYIIGMRHLVLYLKHKAGTSDEEAKKDE